MLTTHPTLAALWEMLIAIGIPAFIVIVLMVFFLSHYRRCPANKLMVIFGKVQGRTAVVIHGGGAMVWPIIQGCAYLSLEPMSCDVETFTNASDGGQVRARGSALVAITTKRSLQHRAAERLLGLDPEHIAMQARGIIIGKLDQTIAERDAASVAGDIKGTLKATHALAKEELKILGLDLLRLDLNELTVESTTNSSPVTSPTKTGLTP